MGYRVLFVALVLLLGAAEATAQVVGAPKPTKSTREPLEYGMFFETGEACVAAFTSQLFRGYIPDPKNVVTPLPADAKGLGYAICALEDVRESKIPDVDKTIPGKQAWVILLPGNPTGFDEFNNPRQDSRCRNTIHKWKMLPLPVGPQGPQGPMGPKGDKGDKGDPGPVTYVDNKPYQAPAREAEWWFGLTGSVAPRVDSGPVSATMASMTGREVCDIQSQYYDGGVAFGKKNSSWSGRIVFAYLPIANGSSTIFNCGNCEVVVETNGANIFGANFEVVKTFGNSKVVPVVTANFGIGQISGGAFRHTKGGLKKIEEVDASELFGTSTFPLLGVGVGASMKLSNSFDATATLHLGSMGWGPRVSGTWKF